MKFFAYIIRYGEIALKGKNRPLFEQKLVQNIKNMLSRSRISHQSIERVYGRLVLYSEEDCASCLKNIFGIVSFSPALKTTQEKEAIKMYTGGSFRVSAQRISKEYPLTSQQMNEKIGKMVVERTGAKVDLKHFNCEIGVEVIGGDLFFFNERIKGLGGLPVGIEGKVGVYCEGWKSVVAAFLMMKRGCIPVFFGEPTNLSLLERYMPQKIVFKKEIPGGISAVVVSDGLLELREYSFPFSVLRPLVGFTEQEVGGVFQSLST